MFERQIGIDLGTVNVLVYVSGRGIVLREPSVVAISIKDNKIVAVGQEARDMLGERPKASKSPAPCATALSRTMSSPRRCCATSFTR
jgi:rod shape-determining protein MreB and related proteins